MSVMIELFLGLICVYSDEYKNSSNTGAACPEFLIGAFTRKHNIISVSIKKKKKKIVIIL